MASSDSSLPGEHAAEPRVRLREVGGQGQAFLNSTIASFSLPLSTRADGQVVVRGRVVRAQLGGLAELRDRLRPGRPLAARADPKLLWTSASPGLDSRAFSSSGMAASCCPLFIASEARSMSR